MLFHPNLKSSSPYPRFHIDIDNNKDADRFKVAKDCDDDDIPAFGFGSAS